MSFPAAQKVPVGNDWVSLSFPSCSAADTAAMLRHNWLLHGLESLSVTSVASRWAEAPPKALEDFHHWVCDEQGGFRLGLVAAQELVGALPGAVSAARLVGQGPLRELPPEIFQHVERAVDEAVLAATRIDRLTVQLRRALTHLEAAHADFASAWTADPSSPTKLAKSFRRLQRNATKLRTLLEPLQGWLLP